MPRPILTLAVLIVLAGGASAGDRYPDRYGPPPPPAPDARYYGPVNNYYAPVTIYAGGAAPYASGSYPAYAPGYATAPPCDATCNGVGYDWSGNYGYSYGYGAYAYPGYGFRNNGYPGVNGYTAMSPWAGYNWAPGNGYW